MNARLLLLLALPLAASAETWTAASTRDGDNWRIDTDSIKTVTVSGKPYKQVAVIAKFKDVVEDFGRKSDEIRSVMLIDCAGKLSANREEHGFFGGKPSYNRTIPDYQLDFVDLFPNSTGSDVGAAVCSK